MGTTATRWPQKREAEEDPEDERGFKLRKRTIRAGLDELWDPGEIPIKAKSRVVAATPTLMNMSEADQTAPKKEDEGVRDIDVMASTSSLAPVKHEASTSTSADTKCEPEPKKQKQGGWKKATVAVDPSSEIYYDPVGPSHSDSACAPDTDTITVKHPPSPPLPPPPSSSSANAPLPVDVDGEGRNLTIKDEPEAAQDVPVTGMFRKRRVPAATGGRATGGGSGRR